MLQQLHLGSGQCYGSWDSKPPGLRGRKRKVTLPSTHHHLCWQKGPSLMLQDSRNDMGLQFEITFFLLFLYFPVCLWVKKMSNPACFLFYWAAWQWASIKVTVGNPRALTWDTEPHRTLRWFLDVNGSCTADSQPLQDTLKVPRWLLVTVHVLAAVQRLLLQIPCNHKPHQVFLGVGGSLGTTFQSS